jgi:hypothetical protein
MGLPVKLSGVHYYRVAGRYVFAGDLIIARGTIYFFPEVDLQEQRDNAAKHLPHEVALVVLVGVYLLQNLSSYSSCALWEEGMSEEQFKKKAEAHIAELKEERSRKGFAESLPLPTRVSASELSNMKLSVTGKLSFFAQSDNHDFNIGLRRRNRLRDALWEAGLLKL